MGGSRRSNFLPSPSSGPLCPERYWLFWESGRSPPRRVPSQPFWLCFLPSLEFRAPTRGRIQLPGRTEGNVRRASPFPAQRAGVLLLISLFFFLNTRIFAARRMIPSREELSFQIYFRGICGCPGLCKSPSSRYPAHLPQRGTRGTGC